MKNAEYLPQIPPFKDYVYSGNPDRSIYACWDKDYYCRIYEDIKDTGYIYASVEKRLPNGAKQCLIHDLCCSVEEGYERIVDCLTEESEYLVAKDKEIPIKEVLEYLPAFSTYDTCPIKVRMALAEREDLPTDYVRYLAKDNEDFEVRAIIAARHDCPDDVLQCLKYDLSHQVRDAAENTISFKRKEKLEAYIKKSEPKKDDYAGIKDSINELLPSVAEVLELYDMCRNNSIDISFGEGTHLHIVDEPKGEIPHRSAIECGVDGSDISLVVTGNYAYLKKLFLSPVQPTKVALDGMDDLIPENKHDAQAGINMFLLEFEDAKNKFLDNIDMILDEKEQDDMER